MQYVPWQMRVVLSGLRAFGQGFSNLFHHAHRARLVPGDAEVEVIADQPYGGDPRQACDVYLPRNRSGLLPVFVFVHGGGWIACDRKMTAALARTIAARGVAVVAPGYRLLPHCLPGTQRADVAASVDWTVTHAHKFGFDLSRLAIGGESAGAHLMLRTVQAWRADWPKPRAIVGVYGLYDIAHLAQDESMLFQPVRHALKQGRSFQEVAEDHSALRPLPWTDVPVLLLHGEADVIVPVDQSHKLRDLLVPHGVSVDVRTYPNASHGFIYEGHPKRRATAASAYRTLYRFLMEAGVAPRRGSMAPGAAPERMSA